MPVISKAGVKGRAKDRKIGGEGREDEPKNLESITEALVLNSPR